MLMTTAHRSALLLSACLAAALAVAQDKKTGDPADVKSAPGEGQKFLQKFVGDWDVTKSLYLKEGEEPKRSKGEARQKMLHGGRFLFSEFTFDTGETKATGTALLGFDPATGLFTSVWTQSRGTAMSFRQGKEKFDGTQIVLYATALPPGEPRASRTVSKLEDDGRKIVHRQYRTQDGKERLTMELVLTRKAGK
jgi:hypothetical protein